MKINIVHMGFFYSGGGERVALEQARYLRRRGHQVNVLAPLIHWDDCYPNLLDEVKPQRFVPPLPAPFPFREGVAMMASAIIPFGLRKLADCDIMLCHSQPSMWLGYRANKVYGIPYVGYLHQLTTFIHRRAEIAGGWASTGDFLLLDGLLGVFGRRLAFHIDRVCHTSAAKLLFNSRWTRKMFEDAYGVTGDVCYPAIDITPKSNVRRKNEVVIASRHYQWKRIDLAFSILQKLRAKTPRLLVTGKYTPHTRYLKQEAARSGVGEHVTFTGYVNDLELAQIYSESKAYMQTSINEPFGLSPLEAQFCGAPAVVWGDAGVKETVEDGETGFYARPYDTTDFAEKLDVLLTDNRTWNRMSRNAKEWASGFNWNSHVDQLERVLDEERR